MIIFNDLVRINSYNIIEVLIEDYKGIVSLMIECYNCDIDNIYASLKKLQGNIHSIKIGSNIYSSINEGVYKKGDKIILQNTNLQKART